MAKRYVPLRIKQYVYWRDDYQCRKCWTRGNRKNRLTLHHVNHNRDDNRAENLVVLCQRCHTAHHKRCGEGDTQ